MSVTLAPPLVDPDPGAGPPPRPRNVVVVVKPPAFPSLGLARMVRSGGYETLSVREPARLRSVVRRRRLDAVIVSVDTLEPIRLLAALRPQEGFALLAVVDPRDLHPGDVLDAGADDVIVLPLDLREFMARLRANLRRSHPPDAAPVVVSTPDFVLDLSNLSCCGPEGTIHLTGIEWQLVEALCRQPGRLVPTQCLLEQVWGSAGCDHREYLRVHLYAVRRKLEPVPGKPRYFITEPGLGLRFRPGGAGTARGHGGAGSVSNAATMA
jgi:two-component system KDP operon response regulator KdpE